MNDYFRYQALRTGADKPGPASTCYVFKAPPPELVEQIREGVRAHMAQHISPWLAFSREPHRFALRSPIRGTRWEDPPGPPVAAWPADRYRK